MRRPRDDEFAEYYRQYVERVPGSDVIGTLEREGQATLALLRGLGEERGDHRYAPGKWSVKEVVGHVLDSERTFALRALAFARREPAALPSFDQDLYVANGAFGERTLAGLTDELAAVRASTVALLGGLSAEAWDRRGVASGCEFTVRASAFVIAGHALHHRAVLQQRYL